MHKRGLYTAKGSDDKVQATPSCQTFQTLTNEFWLEIVGEIVVYS